MGWLEVLQVLDYYSRFPVPAGFTYSMDVAVLGMTYEVALLFAHPDDERALIVNVQHVPKACAMGNLLAHFNEHFQI